MWYKCFLLFVVTGLSLSLSSQQMLEAEQQDFYRYKNSPCYSEIGFVPGKDNESAYKLCEERKAEEAREKFYYIGGALVVLIGLVLLNKSYTKKMRYVDNSQYGRAERIEANKQNPIATQLSSLSILQKYSVINHLMEAAVCDGNKTPSETNFLNKFLDALELDAGEYQNFHKIYGREGLSKFLKSTPYLIKDYLGTVTYEMFVVDGTTNQAESDFFKSSFTAMDCDPHLLMTKVRRDIEVYKAVTGKRELFT